MVKTALAMISAATVLGAVDAGFLPARYLAGGVPELPVRAVAGGEVFLELSVDESGSVTGVRPLRDTPGFTGLAVEAARGWFFKPAEDDVVQKLPNGRQRVVPIEAPAKVFFASIARAPVLTGFTLGEPPEDVASPSPEIAWPINRVIPPYPPLAARSGVVLLEAYVGAEGSVSRVRVLRSSPPFDEAARGALKQWVFRPARRQGVNVPAFVYVAFGFPMPVT